MSNKFFRASPSCRIVCSSIARRRDPQLGRFSFLTADPFDFLEFKASSDPIVDWLATLGADWTAGKPASLPGLPPFQGGAAGLLGYDLSRRLERLPAPRFDEFGVPAIAIGFYDTVVAFDHVTDRAWIISQGFPELEPSRRRTRAIARLKQFRDWLRATKNRWIAGGLAAPTQFD